MKRTARIAAHLSLHLCFLTSCSYYDLPLDEDGKDRFDGGANGDGDDDPSDETPGDGDGDTGDGDTGDGDTGGNGDGDTGDGDNGDGDNGDGDVDPGDGDSPPGDGDGDSSPPGDGDSQDPNDFALLVGAGDIGSCESDGDEQTAELLDSMDGTIFLAGDIAYDDGTAEEFADCFDSSWGRHRERMRPAPGNHEYYNGDEGDAAPYFDYFGEAAGERGKGWYSYELGSWHIIVVNSNCGEKEPRVSCAEDSEQMEWLAEDLRTHPTACTLAYYHHPLFSSGDHGNNVWMQPVWELLHAGGVDVILSGHDHHYERFGPQDADANADPRGIRSFIVGTGGRGHYDIKDIQPNSEVQDSSTFGLLELALRPNSYDYRFVPVADSSFTDEGTADCDNDRVLE